MTERRLKLMTSMMYRILFMLFCCCIFNDVRPEENSPSFAGSSSRQDFLLKKEKIVIEVKKTRRSLGANKIGEELLIDMARYRAR